MNINQTNLDKGTEQLAKTEELSDKLHWHTTARKPTVENIHLSAFGTNSFTVSDNAFSSLWYSRAMWLTRMPHCAVMQQQCTGISFSK